MPLVSRLQKGPQTSYQPSCVSPPAFPFISPRTIGMSRRKNNLAVRFPDLTETFFRKVQETSLVVLLF